MRFAQRIMRIVGAAMLLAALLVGGTTATAHASVGDVCYSALPPQAHHTLDLIASGGPFPYRQDGSTF